MNRSLFALIFLSIFVFACSKADNLAVTEIRTRCAKEVNQCDKECRHGDFHWCYLDPKYNSKPATVRKNCYATHIGRTCRPCKNLYTLNFGGAMSQVSCRDFYLSLQKKNRQCGNCLLKVENVG